MGTINLEEAKVAYEGRDLPAVQLIGKLQTQLREAAARIAAISSALEDLHAALLNSNMIEAKLTLTREDYERFQSLGGADDSERIRQAVMNMIRAEKSGAASSPPEHGAAAMPAGFGPAAPPAESRPELPQSPETTWFQEPEPRSADRGFPGMTAPQPPADPPEATLCPRCQAPIELPAATGDHWTQEVQCGNCGVKYLVKSSPDDLS